MLVMNIWVMRMLVTDDRMLMPMHMRLSHVHFSIVWMLVMFIMRMSM